MTVKWAWPIVVAIASLAYAIQDRPAGDFEALPFSPRHYVIQRAGTPLKIDGKLDDPAWKGATWTAPFVDIEGERRPQPRFTTRARMLWDDERLYVGAELEEPDVWATLTERDSVIFRDNDFELFIDPDGDTHAYYELEVNALATAWDLMLLKPYRDGGPAINGWDIRGLQVGVDIQGTINRAGDHDRGWTVEIAMPWKILKEAAVGQRPPRPGERWRLNFSRVEWQVDKRGNRYRKQLKPGTQDALPEDNWVWSPQGAINMHMPERWGYVQFSDRVSGAAAEPFIDDPNERVKWALRQLYYRQARIRTVTGAFASTLDPLQVSNIDVAGLDFHPALHSTPSSYEITAPGFDGAVAHIAHDGRVWLTR